MKTHWILLLTGMLTGMLLKACGEARPPAAEALGGTIIVASKSGNDVYFVNRASGEVKAIAPTGLEPHEVEVSANGAIAVVSNYGDRENPGHTLSVYEVKSGELINTIDLGEEHTRPHGMQWMGETTRLLVTAEGSRNLLIVDVERAEMVQSLYTGEDVSHMVAANPDFSRAFVPSIRTGNMAVFDLEKGEMIRHVYSGEGAEGIDVSPDGREVWVTNRGENTISVFDAQSLELLEKLPCRDFPIRGKFSPDGEKFLVSNARSGDIAVFDARERTLIGTVKLTPPLPHDVDEDRYFAEFPETSVPIGIVVPDNFFAYVANTRSDAVTEIDLEKLEITRHFEVGEEPDGINFSIVEPQKSN